MCARVSLKARHRDLIQLNVPLSFLVLFSVFAAAFYLGFRKTYRNYPPERPSGSLVGWRL
jgi:hypothetical protein